MCRAPLLVATVLLTACGQHVPVLTVDALAHAPQQLYALRRRCARRSADVNRAKCRVVEAAYAKRFFLGLGGPNEYQTLSSLPPIPESFESDDTGKRP